MNTVTIYKRIITEEGKRRYVLATIKDKNKSGNYCIRYKRNGKRIWEDAGVSYGFAQALQHNRAAELLRGDPVPDSREEDQGADPERAANPLPGVQATEAEEGRLPAGRRDPLSL